MTTRLLLIAVAFVAALPAAAAEIGKATAISVTVSGDARRIRSGEPIFQDETIRTDRTGVGQFEFLDRSRLAIGPDSAVKLDRFLYDPDRSARDVAVELVRGAFRFISGKGARRAYRIETALATIGMRGTTFDVYVAGNGALCVAMINGSVEVCPRGRNCRAHGAVGRYLIVTPDSTFWLLDRWDGSYLGGVPFAVAMPFLADQSALTPGLRAAQPTIDRYRATAP